MRLVVVEWADSVGSVGKTSWSEVLKLQETTIPIIRTVGWVIADTREHLHLVSGYVGGFSAQDFMIPKGCVKKVRYVGKQFDIPSAD